MIKIMKNITVILALPILVFSLLNCGGIQSTSDKISLMQNPPFKISEAYTQSWVAGVEEGGSGTNIYVIFSEMDPEVTVESVYFKRHILEAKEDSKEKNQYVAYLRNDSKSDVIMDADPMKEAQNIPSEVFPFELEANEAVIGYRFDGKKNYYKVSKLSEKDRISYPQSKPRE